MELLHEKTLAVLQAPSPCVTLCCLEHGKPPPCKSQNWRSKPARWNRSCGRDRHLLQSCLRQILKPPNLSLTEDLHPLGPALCKAHGSQALELSAKNTRATPTLQGLLQFRGALGLALLDANAEYFQQSGLFRLLAALPSLDRGSCQAIPHSENSVAQCRRYGNCALHPPKEMAQWECLLTKLQNILNNKLILNKYVLQENDNYILHL